jgi:outer membrane lipoprotein LolB
VKLHLRRPAGIGVVLALFLGLSGCAQLPWMAAGDSGIAEVFEAQGRVYVRYGPRAFSGSLRWRHAPERDEVWLGGPFGQTGAHIARDATGAILTTADQQEYRAGSIEALTREGLGWSLPLADLSYYVLGKVPQDAAASAERDADGRIVRATRDGWSVRWVALGGEGSAPRPGRIELSKEELEIRFVVDRLDRAANADGGR